MNFTKIKGEDKPQNIVRLPRLGKIRLGVKKKSLKTGNEYPTETDYFVCPDEVKKVYGERPKVIDIMIPVEKEEMFLKQYYACYGSDQNIKCIGDGEKAERREGEKEIIECPSPSNCDYGKKKKCSARMDLMVVLPEVNVGGVYQISTGSINSSIDVRSGLMMARSIYGRVSWLPMVLKREEKKIKNPNTGRMDTHYPVKLNMIGTMGEVKAIKAQMQSPSAEMMVEEPTIEGGEPDTPVVVVDDRSLSEREGKTRAAQAILADVSTEEDEDSPF